MMICTVQEEAKMKILIERDLQIYTKCSPSIGVDSITLELFITLEVFELILKSSNSVKSLPLRIAAYYHAFTLESMAIA
jgi:hypothetical protein